MRTRAERSRASVRSWQLSRRYGWADVESLPNRLKWLCGGGSKREERQMVIESALIEVQAGGKPYQTSLCPLIGRWQTKSARIWRNMSNVRHFLGKCVRFRVNYLDSAVSREIIRV